MSETVQFWLDNKMSAGIKVAAIDDQVLVVYREKFYVVEKGAAQMRGGKSLYYSKSSMPLIWKKALRGEVSSADTVMPPDETLPMATITKKERTKQAAPAAPNLADAANQAPATEQPSTRLESKPIRNTVKTAVKPLPQTTVPANCPHCNHKHEIPLEKGRNGKPFFLACARCQTEFAVRFVPVTMFQAQVAGFR